MTKEFLEAFSVIIRDQVMMKRRLKYLGLVHLRLFILISNKNKEQTVLQ